MSERAEVRVKWTFVHFNLAGEAEERGRRQRACSLPPSFRPAASVLAAWSEQAPRRCSACSSADSDVYAASSISTEAASSCGGDTPSTAAGSDYGSAGEPRAFFHDEKRLHWASECADDEVASEASVNDSISIQPIVMTLVLQNIPCRAGASDVLDTIRHNGFDGRFEYFYMPLKPKSGQNRGWAIVSFSVLEDAEQFCRTMNGQPFFGRESKKLLSVEPALSQLGICEKVERGLQEFGLRTEFGIILAMGSGSRS